MSNVGQLDRIIRGSAGISIAFAELTGFLGIFEIVLEIFAFGLAIFLTFTALMGYCPFYPILGISTCPVVINEASKSPDVS
ncbi:MAG TPA: DUF2892 domain-containing protein [Candidatus Thalassarchaeaceae archaeon]|nr:MAG TPA: DUF2892 domain-containing protein [Candidatus Poseidoniales archaeon]HIH84239.1 DUF2892 domain-containing protein [Candidatus Thalassarchaeaceae archaeon]